MQVDLPRRYFVAAALSACLLPRALRAKTAALITGKTFRGNRAPDGTRGDGGEGLRAKPNMVIRQSSFIDLGNGGVRVNVPIDHLTIENCTARNLYRFLEDTASNKANPANLTNFTVRGVTARAIDRSMTRIRYRSHGGTIEDVIAYGSDRCALYCVGFQLEDKAHDISYTRAQAHDFREASRPAYRYWNGDGFSDERGNFAIRYLSCTATGCSDGGFDLKSANVFLKNCLARGNKRNFRLWNSGELHQCRSEDPHHYGGTGGAAHFAFHSAAKRYVIDRPVVRAAAGNTAPVFLIDTKEPLTLVIRDADIAAPDAPLFAVNGPEPTIQWLPDRSRQHIRVLRDRA